MSKHIVSLLLILAIAGVASATNILWYGSNDGSKFTGYWDEATNWSPIQVPIAGDSARFDAAHQPAEILVRNYDTTPTGRIQWRTNAGTIIVQTGAYMITDATTQPDPSAGRTAQITIQSGATFWGGARNTTTFGDFEIGRQFTDGDTTCDVYGTLIVTSQNLANGLAVLGLGHWTGAGGSLGSGTLNIYNGALVEADSYMIATSGGTYKINIAAGGKMRILGNAVSQINADILGGYIVGPSGMAAWEEVVGGRNYTYVPEPATIALLGLGSLMLLRKKR